MKEKRKVIRFIDLFAGIGGFHYAIDNVLKRNNLISKLVMASEIDIYAKKVYALNHKIKLESILNIKEYTEGPKSKNKLQDLGKVDLIMAGFPCQSFSNAGNREGFLDKTRGTLIFDVMEIIKIKKPKYVLLENVKHLLKHSHGKTFDAIISTLVSLGYKVPSKPIILSPNQLGIPQIRWRIFIPAILKDKSSNSSDSPFNFDKYFKKKLRQINFDKQVDKSCILKSDDKMLKAIRAWGEFIKKVKRPLDKTLPVIWLDYMNDKNVDTSNMKKWRAKYIKDMQEIYKKNKLFIDKWKKKYEVDKWKKRERKLEWQAGKDNYNYEDAYLQFRQSGLRFKKKGIFPTLVAIVQTSLIFDDNIKKWRYLSLEEIRQLQSFPKIFKLGDVPTYQSYKQFGNSINIKVVEIVLKELLSLN